jgi:hypothetical protein
VRGARAMQWQQQRPLPFHERAGAEAKRDVERAPEHGEDHVRPHCERAALEVRLHNRLRGRRRHGRQILHLRLRGGVLLLRPRNLPGRGHPAPRRQEQRRRTRLRGLQPRRGRPTRHRLLNSMQSLWRLWNWIPRENQFSTQERARMRKLSESECCAPYLGLRFLRHPDWSTFAEWIGDGFFSAIWLLIHGRYLFDTNMVSR